MLAGGVAMGAAARVWPFRVYSFPKQVEIIEVDAVPLLIAQLNETTYKYLMRDMAMTLFNPSPIYHALAKEKGWKVG